MSEQASGVLHFTVCVFDMGEGRTCRKGGFVFFFYFCICVRCK